MVEFIAHGAASGELDLDGPHRAGTIFFTTVQGIVTLVNGGLASAQELDELVELAVEQFLRGARRTTAT